MEIKTFQHFSQSMSPLNYEIYEILRNVDHPEYENLVCDLQSIDPEELNKYIIQNDIDFYIKNTSNIDLERRICFLESHLNYEIPCKKLEVLINNKERPMPYDSTNLKNIIISDDKLVDISLFNIKQIGIVYNNYGYALCPTTNSDNSSYWLFQEIANLTLKERKK